MHAYHAKHLPFSDPSLILLQIHIEFRPEAFDGILLLSGERDDLTGDFVALLIHQGFVEFW